MQNKERNTAAWFTRGMHEAAKEPASTPGNVRNEDAQLSRKEYMVDIPLLAMVIASAVSLIVVSPRKARQEALRALREYDEAKFVHASVSKLTAAH